MSSLYKSSINSADIWHTHQHTQTCSSKANPVYNFKPISNWKWSCTCKLSNKAGDSALIWASQAGPDAALPCCVHPDRVCFWSFLIDQTKLVIQSCRMSVWQEVRKPVVTMNLIGLLCQSQQWLNLWDSRSFPELHKRLKDLYVRRNHFYCYEGRNLF